MDVIVALALLTTAPTTPEADAVMAFACSMVSAVELEIVMFDAAVKVGFLRPLPAAVDDWVRAVTRLLMVFSTTPVPTATPMPAARDVATISAFKLALPDEAAIVIDPLLVTAGVLVSSLLKLRLGCIAVMVIVFIELSLVSAK